MRERALRKQAGGRYRFEMEFGKVVKTRRQSFDSILFWLWSEVMINRSRGQFVFDTNIWKMINENYFY